MVTKREQHLPEVVIIITATSGNGAFIVHALQNIQDNMAFHSTVIQVLCVLQALLLWFLKHAGKVSVLIVLR